MSLPPRTPEGIKRWIEAAKNPSCNNCWHGYTEEAKVKYNKFCEKYTTKQPEWTHPERGFTLPCKGYRHGS